jgi:hypothetical protein
MEVPAVTSDESEFDDGGDISSDNAFVLFVRFGW